ncbi:hypothetical protein COW99_05795 [Candidatus Roizmanbacteria bacterium CG22_combo_CG10-13_8_21_14_all_38_20]|uniref:30S ribosomal protein S21 n=1 Tax=Candidatus Roizmanbacteria bacterium CG22_combo_CG10-13_8_21_14_all_38_20 TaxID=1974862 RepID=A0A2H0BTU2_9BACT|nr:30S ribosomal protein S21 [bacterium]PIP61106.1 MAG: hypothetical protein COW99_05795 [Candidatus Roizmanbacteria bacterium CG22_combo_CG10-13_8_21_14_all_38_20]PJC32208.1 MAG: hypothetical protein CO050_00515 [Candidatus Roizmanbacteria bacterium CG_4_9_14_0_2_um_filter_38_17]
MVTVSKKKGETTYRLVSRFKRRVADEEVLDDAKEASIFEPEAEKRKKKKYRLERLNELARGGE